MIDQQYVKTANDLQDLSGQMLARLSEQMTAEKAAQKTLQQTKELRKKVSVAVHPSCNEVQCPLPIAPFSSCSLIQIENLESILYSIFQVREQELNAVGLENELAKVEVDTLNTDAHIKGLDQTLKASPGGVSTRSFREILQFGPEHHFFSKSS